MFDWIHTFANWLVYQVFGIAAESQIGESLQFFIYDSLKVLLLLFIIVFIMGIVNEYFPTEKIRSILHKKKLFGLEYFFASIFGALTPFCSCSSVPLFIGFIQGGIPLGVTFSFLITSPLVNEVAIAMFLGIFGIKVTLIYAGAGILVGTIGGWLLGKFNLEPLLSEWVQTILKNKEEQQSELDPDSRSFLNRLPNIITDAYNIVKGVLLYIIIGIGIGALIHGFIPENFFTEYLGRGQWWSVPLAVILAVPMYANAAAIVPIIEVFVAKGVPLGTAIAFMMATVGLSLPEGTMLKKVMSWKLIAIFFALTATCMIFLGFLFNQVL